MNVAKSVAASLDRAVRSAIELAAERVEQRAKRNILATPFGAKSVGEGESPISQKNVRNSIAEAIHAKNVLGTMIVEVEGSDGGLSTVAADGDPLPLAPLIELGFTITHAYYGRKRKAAKNVQPRPFLVPALEETRREIAMIVGRAAAATIKQWHGYVSYGATAKRLGT